jgi:hypothetical protein
VIAVPMRAIKRAIVAMLSAGIVGAYAGSSMVGASSLARDVALRVVADWTLDDLRSAGGLVEVKYGADVQSGPRFLDMAKFGFVFTFAWVSLTVPIIDVSDLAATMTNQVMFGIAGSLFVWMLWRLGSRIAAEDCAPWCFR